MSPRDQWRAIVDVALRAEELGFDHIWVYDHFHTVPKPLPGRSVFEAWTLMAALAPLTKRIRLGQLVTCALYRNPAYLAKISSVVDVISGGRLELGIGACWYEHEFRGYGYAFPRARERIEMLEETVEVLKRMWTEPVVSFRGRYYRLEGAINDPKPLQKPHPPILIGGGGERRTLRVVAKHADKWNYGGSYEEYSRKLEALRRHCEAVGRDPRQIVLTWVSTAIVGRTEEEARRKFEEYEAARLSGARYEDWKVRGLVGTPSEALETLDRFRELGVREVYVFIPNVWRRGELEFFADEVVKHVR